MKSRFLFSLIFCLTMIVMGGSGSCGSPVTLMPAKGVPAKGVEACQPGRAVFLVASDPGVVQWQGATANLESAIKAANEVNGEVWVAQGTYLNPNVSLRKNTLLIYGGFTGKESKCTERPKDDSAFAKTVWRGGGIRLFDDLEKVEINGFSFDKMEISSSSRQPWMMVNSILNGVDFISFDSEVDIMNCLFTNLKEIKIHGGGKITDSQFFNNEATRYLISLNQSSLEMDNVVLEGNKASSLIGGYKMVTIKNSLLRNNKVEFYLSWAYTHFINTVISGNTMVRFGEDESVLVNVTAVANQISAKSSVVLGYTIINSILWENKFEFDDRSEIYNPYNTAFVYYSNLQYLNRGLRSQHPFGDKNIDADPQFVDFENGDYRLQATSLCLGAGISNFKGFVIPDANQEGTPWPKKNPNMGAY